MTAMQCHPMTDCYLVFEDCRMILRADVNDTTVLNIRTITDANEIHITAYHGSEPNARFFTDLDIADDERIFCDECGGVNLWMFTAEAFYHLNFRASAE